jgi:hypothetical protein
MASSEEEGGQQNVVIGRFPSHSSFCGGKNQGTWPATRCNLCNSSSGIMPPKRGAKESVGDVRNDHIRKE